MGVIQCGPVDSMPTATLLTSLTADTVGATALAPWTDGSCLPNFQATADPAELARKYDAARLTRLASLADTYDPQHVIAAADGIRAAASR